MRNNAFKKEKVEKVEIIIEFYTAFGNSMPYRVEGLLITSPKKRAPNAYNPFRPEKNEISYCTT